MTSEQRATLADFASDDMPACWNLAIVQTALTAALGTCGDCAHANDSDSLFPSLNTYCTKRLSFYNGKLMEKSSRCQYWTAQTEQAKEPPTQDRYCEKCRTWVRAYECCGAGTRPQSRGGAK